MKSETRPFSRLLLLLTSVVFFAAAGSMTIDSGGKAFSFIKIFLLLLVSFVSLTAFFARSEKFQDLLDWRPGRKLILLVFASGCIFYLAVSYLLHGIHDRYAVSLALDSISYYTQAKIFSTGSLSVPSHELKDFFTTGYFINDGKFYTKYFPGWPLLLSIGVFLKAPWIINPIFGLLTMLVIFFLGQEIYDKETGLFAALLLLFSANFYFLNTGYLSEPSSLFFSTLFFYLLVRTLKNPRTLTTVLAGLSLGVAFMIRPYSAVAVSLPVISYFIYSLVIKREKLLGTFLVFSISFLPAIVLLLTYNYLQTGSLLQNIYELYNPLDKLGFGLRSPDTFLEPFMYTPVIAIKNMAMNLGIVNWLGIPFLFIFLIIVAANKKNKWDYLLFATFVSIVIFHLFYHAKSSRYYHPSFFTLALLTARGINFSGSTFAKFIPGMKVKNLNRFFIVFILMANILVVISPHKVFSRIEFYKQLRDPYTLAKKNNLSNSVIFLKSVPESYNNITYYVQNPLDYSGNVLFVRNLKERNPELMEFYPDKDFYTYEFDRKSRSGKLTKTIPRRGKK